MTTPPDLDLAPMSGGIVTPDWVRDAVFYQIFPDRFARSSRVVPPGPLEAWNAPPTPHGFKGGDLYGVLEHLDHLTGMGVNAIYFNPVFASASNHRYHTYDYLAIDPLLGGEEAFRALIDACHDRGIRVVIDGVFNHASRGFWPFHHVLEAGKHSPYRDWFFFHGEDLDAGRPIRAYPLEPSSVDLSTFLDDPGLGTRSLGTLGYQAWWDLPALPKLNTDNPHVRDYLLGVAEHWIRFGVDGWRLDVAEEVPDRFWRLFRERVKAADPDAYIVAEIWGERPEVLRGDTFDALMNYPLGQSIASFTGAGRIDERVTGQHQNLRAAVRDEDGAQFLARISRTLSIYDPAVAAVQMNLLDSHDTPRFLSIVGGDVTSLRLALTILMTLPGAPTIYYGDEIGLTGELDPYSRGAFPWDEPESWDRDLLAFVTEAIALRHRHPVLRRGRFEAVGSAGRAVGYVRTLDDAAALIVVNAGDEPERLSIAVPDAAGRSFREVLATVPGAGPGALALAGDGRAEVVLSTRSGAVLLAG